MASAGGPEPPSLTLLGISLCWCTGMGYRLPAVRGWCPVSTKVPQNCYDTTGYDRIPSSSKQGGYLFEAMPCAAHYVAGWDASLTIDIRQLAPSRVGGVRREHDTAESVKTTLCRRRGTSLHSLDPVHVKK